MMGKEVNVRIGVLNKQLVTARSRRESMLPSLHELEVCL